MKFFGASEFNLLILTIFTSLVTESVLCNEQELEIHNTFKPEQCDRKAKVTDILTLHYKGTLENGQVFDSSVDRREPFSFQLGIGQVIQGWDKGLVGVCVGEQIKLVIPPNLAYGDSAHEKIPAGSTLIFDIEILTIEDGPSPVNVFREIDEDGDTKLSRHEVGEFLKKQLALAQHGAGGDTADHNKMLDEVFNHEDKDNDGFITRDEFSGPKYDHEEL